MLRASLQQARPKKGGVAPVPGYAALLLLVPKRTRTSGLQVRNLALYPAELWAHARQMRDFYRRGWDSNPRYPLKVQLLSREPDSATLAPLQCFRPK